MNSHGRNIGVWDKAKGKSPKTHTPQSYRQAIPVGRPTGLVRTDMSVPAPINIVFVKD